MAHLGLAEEPPGVAGHQGDQHQLGRPLGRVLQAGGARGRRHQAVGDGDGEGACGGQLEGEAKAAGEAGGDDGADDREHERRVPVAGGGHRHERQNQLGQQRQQADAAVLIVGERPERPVEGVDDEGDAPAGHASVDGPAQGRHHEAEEDGAPPEGRDQRPEGRQPVGRV